MFSKGSSEHLEVADRSIGGQPLTQRRQSRPAVDPDVGAGFRSAAVFDSLNRQP
jgi:hypothetical protein